MDRRGFSLIELAIVLGVIAVIVGVLVPLVYTHLEDTRKTRAVADLRTIADAVRLYRDDAGEYPIFVDVAAANDDTAAASLLATASGSSPSGTNWTSGIYGIELERFLNGNFLNRSTSAGGGRTVFRGPYIGRVETDPWGSKYYLTAANLEDDSAYYAFVISAGPDQTIDTTKDQSKSGDFTVSGDDIVVRIR